MTATANTMKAVIRLDVSWPSPTNRKSRKHRDEHRPGGEHVRDVANEATTDRLTWLGFARHAISLSVVRFTNIGCRATNRRTIPCTREGVVVRRARTSDARRQTPGRHLCRKILLEKNLVTLYEAVQEFWVAEVDSEVVGCGALHVLWADLGEVRTVAVDPKVKGRGIGHLVVDQLLEVARELELERLFVLTFETGFFARHGFSGNRGNTRDGGGLRGDVPLLRRRCRRVPGSELCQAEHSGQYPNVLVL